MRTLSFVLAATLLALSAGCTAKEWNDWKRQAFNEKPPDYEPTPLGVQYDTPAKAAKLTDSDLRVWTAEWFKVREQYVDLWQKHGSGDRSVQAAQNRMQLLRAVIQDKASNLQEMGRPW